MVRGSTPSAVSIPTPRNSCTASASCASSPAGRNPISSDDVIIESGDNKASGAGGIRAGEKEEEEGLGEVGCELDMAVGSGRNLSSYSGDAAVEAASPRARRDSESHAPKEGGELKNKTMKVLRMLWCGGMRCGWNGMGCGGVVRVFVC